MATNEILPFASTNTGTNLLTQAEYAADAQRTTGHQPGIARSKLENKALRQASLLAAGLAEFIADYQANNVTDSLTPQNIADYLLAAIQANIPEIAYATTTTAGKVTLAGTAEAQSYSSGQKVLTPADMYNALKGANQSFNSNGYQKFPGGLIIQWGFVNNWTTHGDTTLPITFPITFPAAVYSYNWIMVGPSTSMLQVPMISGVSLSGMTLIADKQQDLTETRDATWIAIGR